MEVTKVSDAREPSLVTQSAPVIEAAPATESATGPASGAPSAIADEHREDVGSDVTRDQVDLLFQHANVTLIAGGLLVVLASSALSAWGRVDPAAMLRWMAVMAAALLLRGFCVWRYFDSHGQRRPLYWANLFAASAVVTGLAWFSLIGAVDITDPATRDLATLVVVGVASSALVYAAFY